MLRRSLEGAIRTALSDTPVVMLVGARQSGKSTLAETLVGGRNSSYTSFDEPRLLAAATADPVQFLEELGETAVLDEVQRVPQIFLPIKASVDRDRRPGRFLLTGSSNPLFIPEVSEALAGRVEILTLWPLAAAELEGRDEWRLARVLLDRDRHPRGVHPVDRHDLSLRVVSGGFPEAVERDDEERRDRWFSSYLTTMLERDLRAVAGISRIEELPNLLTGVALRSRGHLNKSALSQDLGIPVSSIDRYLVLLERTYLVRRMPGWRNRLGPRLVKSPKLLLCDSGLLCHLMRWNQKRLLSDSSAFGLALESFVGIELAKAVDLESSEPRLMHYRTSKGVEIDFVLEGADGLVTAVEVKASGTLSREDFRRFDRLRETLGSRFVRGVVFYTGDRVLPFGDRLEGWPISILWGAE